VFESVASSPLGFWIVAFLLSLIDSVVLLREGEFTFRITRGVKVRIRTVAVRFLMRGREPVVALLSYPAAPFVICSAEASPYGVSGLRRALFAHKTFERRFRALTAAAMFCLILTCAVGPALSLQYGISRSLLMVWPLMYAAAFGILGAVTWRRRALDLTTTELLTIGLEFLFCPFLAVNIWKKLAARRRWPFNAEELADHFSEDRSAAARVRADLARDHADEP